MKKVIILLIVLFTSCSMQKHADPCRQCPQYSHNDNYILWEYIKLSPYPHEYASKQ